MDLATLTELAIGKAVGPQRTDVAVDVSSVYVRALINEALHKVERAALWKFSEAETSLTLPAGSTSLPAPADLAIPLMVRNDGDDLILQFHDERQRFSDPGSAQNAAPTHYGIWNKELRFSPPPVSATPLTLRYYRSWVDLVADTDEPPFPATWHDILSDYAAARLILRLPPTGGRYLPSSAAEPLNEAWQAGLQAMLASPLVLPTGDVVESHAVTDAVEAFEGVDW